MASETQLQQERSLGKNHLPVMAASAKQDVVISEDTNTRALQQTVGTRRLILSAMCEKHFSCLLPTPKKYPVIAEKPKA